MLDQLRKANRSIMLDQLGIAVRSGRHCAQYDKQREINMLGKKQMEACHQELERLAQEAENVTCAEDERKLYLQYRDYAPDAILGRDVCNSYSEEDLIAILRKRTEQLGHAPSQAEVFLFYRTYIKHRFGTWPAALRAAGLSRAQTEIRALQEDWEPLWREEHPCCCDLIRLSERWESLGYPPKRTELPEEGMRLKIRFQSWSSVLNAARALDAWLDREKTPEPQNLPDFESLRAIAERLGRTPLKAEVPEELRVRLRCAVGSWNRVLKQAGLTPHNEEMARQAEEDRACRSRAGNGPIWKAEQLSDADRAMLDQLQRLCRKLGRAPRKEEAPPELRTALIGRFSSWRNALYQIGVAALTKGEEAAIKQAERDRARRAKRLKG